MIILLLFTAIIYASVLIGMWVSRRKCPNWLPTFLITFGMGLVGIAGLVHLLLLDMRQ